MEFRFKAGRLPLLVSMPHAGTDIPDDVAATLMPCAAARADTDWHLPELYGFLEEMGASTLSARWSRYLIDLNRPPENTNLYPGPGHDRPVPGRHLRPRAPVPRGHGAGPGRGAAPPGPLLAALPHAAARGTRPPAGRARPAWCCGMRTRSHPQVPRFFEGRLPDLNFGTADGKSCSRQLEGAMIELVDRPGPASPSSSTAASRAATSRASTAIRPPACTPSSWRWRSACTWTRRRRSATVRTWPARCSRCCANCSGAAGDWVRTRATNQLFARHALLSGGWRDDVLLEWDGDGQAGAAVQLAATERGRAAAEFVLPGIVNLHSPRLPARHGRPGRERRAGPPDSFWTWRELMYRFAGRITPEQMRGGGRPAVRGMPASRLHGRSANSTTCSATPAARSTPTRPRRRCAWREAGRALRHRPDHAAGDVQLRRLRRAGP